jgi:flavin reductase (DIM6/NTAB) family NADH-FMN oxidoreductase RutF
MFYRPGQDDHGLPHNPFKALVAPRPIGWISSRDAQGRFNLAPYSFFNGIADAPPMVMFCSNGRKGGRVAPTDVKDSLANIHDTGVFAANVVGAAQREAMNLSSGAYAHEDDEFALTGLTAAPCKSIDCPRVAESPATLECTLVRIVDLPGWGETENRMVIGVVTGIHIADEMLVDGKVDVTRYRPLARLGYMDYTSVTETFSMRRPG